MEARAAWEVGTRKIAEAFRQFERYNRTHELPDLDVVTDAWIHIELRHRNLATRAAALRAIEARGEAAPLHLDELREVEADLRGVQADREVLRLMRRAVRDATSAPSRDHAATRAAVQRLTAKAMLERQERKQLGEEAEAWRELS